MAEAPSRCPLPDGKIYHFNVIYNHARSPLSVTPDTQLSRAFTEKVVATLESLGYVNCYFQDRDCLPGRNVFTELFRVVEGSDYTIVVLTTGFVKDCWSRYTQQSTFKKLLDQGQTYKFLPLSVALRESDLPQELTTEHVLCFGENWESDASAWSRLSRVFTENIPVPEVTRGQHLPSRASIQETNTPDGQVNFSGRDDLDHASELPEPQGDGQRGGLVHQNQSLGHTEVPVGRSHFVTVHETNSENTGATDEIDSGRTDRVDETTDRVREEEAHCGSVAERESVGEPSNAQSYIVHAQDGLSFLQSVTQVEQDGELNTEGQMIESQNKVRQNIENQETRQNFESQNTTIQIFQSQNTERQNIENQDTTRHNTERQNIEGQNTESQDVENKDTTSQNKERQNVEGQNTESQNIENQDTTRHNTERQNIEGQNTESQDIGSQTAELQNIESQITEIQNTENQITNSQITEGISMDLSRRQMTASIREQQGNTGLGETSQTYQEHYREQDQGTGGYSTSMQGRGTAIGKGDWVTGAQNISSLSLPNTSLEEDQGDLESSVVNRLERTGMAGFRHELVQTRRRSTDDTSEKRINEGRYRYSVDIKSSSQYSFKKQDMEKSVHDVDQTKLKLPENETKKDSSNQGQAPALANQDVSSSGKSSSDSFRGTTDVSYKQPVHNQNTTDQTRPPTENTSTIRQDITKVDEASELEAVLFRTSLRSLEDSGISESGSCSTEASTDSESLLDSSPEEKFSGDNTFGQSMLTSSERGTPDGSVQEMKTTELHAQSRHEDKPAADLEFPSNVACNNHGESDVKKATGKLGGSNHGDLSPARVSGHDCSFVDQTTSLEVLNASGRTQTDTRSLLKKQSVTDTISLTNDALEQFPTSQTSMALTPTGSEKAASSHKVTLFDDKCQEHHKSRQTNTELVENLDPQNKTSEEFRPQQDTLGDSRHEGYSCHDTVSTVTEKSTTMQGTDTRFAFVKQVEQSTSSTAAGYRSEGSGAYTPKPNDESANTASEPRRTSWLLPACKLIFHLMTRAENPFLV